MVAETRMAMLVDVAKCMACRGCQVACKQWNQLPAEKTRFTGTYQNPPRLSAKTWTLVEFIEPEDFNQNPRWLFRKTQCLHCGNPTCVQVCPTGAAKQRADGVVYIDQSICAGCKYCVETCPFGTPHADLVSGTAKKCRMCLDRLDDGLKPACVSACPTGALDFGPREDMLVIARARKAALASEGFTPRIYGETELGGLGVLYLLPEKASVYGLPEHPRMPTEKILLRWILGVIPGVALLYGMWRYFWKEEPVASGSGGK